MHERNLYKDGVDFDALASSYLPLKQHIARTSKGTPTIDFKNTEAQRHLTEALLYRDFAITLTLPPNRLCPAVPNRLDYVLWIQDIVDTACPQQNVAGIDVGVGASAVYPLLACRLRQDWRMIGTDIDGVSATSAEANIEANGVSSRIRVYLSSRDSPIFKVIEDHPEERFAFTMCNPPFYSSQEDIQNSAAAKEFNPFAVCTGADVEMVTDGGETGFVARMIEESKGLSDRCQWFTSLLGKSSSVTALVDTLRLHQISNYGVTEFVQSHTKRWAIAWSFGGDRLPESLGRGVRSPQFTGYLPLPNELAQSYDAASPQTILQALLQVLSRLPSVSIIPQQEPSTVIISATSNCWSRAARRQKAPVTAPTPTAIQLRCELRVAEGVLRCRWLRGTQRELFESFWSHVARKIGSRIQQV